MLNLLALLVESSEGSTTAWRVGRTRLHWYCGSDAVLRLSGPSLRNLGRGERDTSSTSGPWPSDPLLTLVAKLQVRRSAPLKLAPEAPFQLEPAAAPPSIAKQDLGA